MIDVIIQNFTHRGEDICIKNSYIVHAPMDWRRTPEVKCIDVMEASLTKEGPGMAIKTIPGLFPLNASEDWESAVATITLPGKLLSKATE